jgi:hypothetical protein
MYDIIEAVSDCTLRCNPGDGPLLTRLENLGEEETKALHQPDSVRELHVPGCPRCVRQSYAEYVMGTGHTISGWKLTYGQTNTPRDTQERGIMEEMSSSTKPRVCAKNEHSRRLGWMRSNGVLTFRVS